MGLFNSKELEQLRAENLELKGKIHQLYEKDEKLKSLDEILKKMKHDISMLNDEKRYLLAEVEKSKSDSEKKKNEIADLESRLNDLNKMKNELQNTIHSYSDKVNEIEKDMKQNVNSAAINEEIISGEEKKKALLEEQATIEKNIHELKHTAVRYTQYNNQIKEAVNLKKQDLRQIETRISALAEKESKIKISLVEQEKELERLKNNDIVLSQMKEESEKLNQLKAEKQKLLTTLLSLKSEEEKFISKIKGLSADLQNKEDLLKNIDGRLEISESNTNVELTKVNRDLLEKNNLLNEAAAKLNKVEEDTKLKEKELYSLDQTLTIKAQKAGKLNQEMQEIEIKIKQLKDETAQFESLRNEVQAKLMIEKQSAGKYLEEHRKLLEIIPLLEKRKTEIEQSNTDLENRFMKIFQRLNQEWNAITSKRNVLEQIILKKEKDLYEKDQSLFEKIAALEESERILSLRQTEVEAVEQLLINLNDQKEIIKNDLLKLEEEGIERKHLNDEIKLETEMVLKKKISMEKGLQELLNYMNTTYEKTKDRNQKSAGEIKYYEEQLFSLREKISESLKEQEQMQVSINDIRIEYEEYRGNISKLLSMKKRVQEEISKHQSILQRYQKVREKLKIEQPVQQNEKSKQLPEDSSGRN